MKKLVKSMFMLSALTASVLFTSCGDDAKVEDKTYAAPTLKVNDGVRTTSSAATLATVSLKVVATADTDRKIKKVTITRAVTDQSTATIIDSTYDAATVNRTYEDQIAGNIVINDGDKITYSVKIEDDKGKTAIDSLVITIASMATSPQILLGAPSNTTNDYRFFGIADGFRRYRADSTGADLARQNASKVDFIFFYSTSGSVQNALYSPDYPFATGEGWNKEISFWPTKNNTLYKSTTITSSEFDALQGSTFLTELATIDFSVGTLNRLANLSVNQVIAFIRKSDGKRGFILIGNPAAGATGQILLVCKAEL
jgi:hypothetical protein